MPFQYRPYRNQHVGSITDLMGRGRDAEAQALIDSANAQAQAARVSGQAWGGAVQSIGNTIAAIPGQMQAQQDRDRVMEQRERDDQTRAMTASMFNHPSQIGPTIADGTLLPTNGQLEPDLYIPSTPGAAVEGANSMAGDFEGMAVAEGLELPNPFTTKDANGSELFDLGKIGSGYLGAGLDIPEKTMATFELINQSITGQFDESVKNAQNLALQYLEGDPRVWGVGIDAAVKVFTDNGLFPPEQMASIHAEVKGLKALPQSEKKDAEEKLLRRLVGDRADREFGQNLYDVTLADGTVISGASQVDGTGGDRFYVDPNGKRLRDVTGVRRQQYSNYGGAAGYGLEGAESSVDFTDFDLSTRNMLQHAGLNLNEMLVAIGQTSRLPRGWRRDRAIAGANQWFADRGIDPSTMAAEFDAYNDALKFNVRKFNLVRNAETEIYEDIQNLRQVIDRLGLNDVQVFNQIKAWTLGQVTDPRAAEYLFLINQLQNDLTLYNQASQGGGTQAPTDALRNEAKEMIRAGASQGTLEGLLGGLERSIAGMTVVNQEALNRIRHRVWGLFGVGDRYDPVESGVPEVRSDYVRQRGPVDIYIPTPSSGDAPIGTNGTGTQPTGDGDEFDPYALPPAVTTVPGAPGDNEVDINIQGRNSPR